MTYMIYLAIGFVVGFVVVFFMRKWYLEGYLSFFDRECVIHYFDSNGAGRTLSLGMTIFPYRFWEYFYFYPSMFAGSNVNRCVIGIGIAEIYFDYTTKFSSLRLIKVFAENSIPILALLHSEDGEEILVRVLYSREQEKIVYETTTERNEIYLASLSTFDGVCWDFQNNQKKYSLTFLKPIGI